MTTLAKEVEALLATAGEDSLTAIVDLGVVVAAADGSIDDAELGRLAELLDGALGGLVEPTLIRHFVREARARCEREGLADRARAVGAELAKKGGASAALRVAFAIATASGGVSEPERGVLLQLSDGAGLGAAGLAAAIGAS